MTTTETDPFDIDIGAVELEQASDAPKTRKPRADKGQARGPRRSSQKLANDLLNPWAKLAKTLMWGAPTVAAVMMDGGERTVDAIVSIASEHPRMLAALQKVSKIGPATDLADMALSIVVAAFLDFGRIPPEHPLATLSGVASLYYQVRQPVEEDTPPEPGNGYVMSVPPGFTPPPGFH